MEKSNDPILTIEQLNCSICQREPIRIFETICWGKLLCQGCQPVRICPFNCGNTALPFWVVPNRFLQNLIQGFFISCKFWHESFDRTKIEDHYEQCKKNKSKCFIVKVNPYTILIWIRKTRDAQPATSLMNAL